MIGKLKKLRQHNVVKNSVALFALQFVSMLAPLLVFPYLARVLGIDGFGFVILAFSVSAIGQIITDYGFSLSATYTISKNRDKIEYVSELIGAIFVIKLLLTSLFLLGIIFYACFVGFGMESPLLAFYIGLNVLAQAFLPTWFFQGIERMKNVTIYMVISKISYVLMVFVFINNKNDIDTVVLLLAISNLIASVVAIRFIYLNGYVIKKPSLKLIKISFKQSTQFFMSRAAVSIYTSASTIVVASFAGMQQAAIYGASEKLYQASQSITSPISQALFPYMARNKNDKLLIKIIIFVGVPLSLCCLFAGIWADEIMALIFGDAFSDSGQVLKIFLLITVVNFIAVNFGYPAFSAIGQIHIANRTVIFGAIIQLILLTVLFLSGRVSAYSVVLSVLLVELFVMFSRLFFYEKYRSGN